MSGRSPRFYAGLSIVTSLFTSVFCTKVIFDWLVRGLRVRKLAVG